MLATEIKTIADFFKYLREHKDVHQLNTTVISKLERICWQYFRFYHDFTTNELLSSREREKFSPDTAVADLLLEIDQKKVLDVLNCGKVLALRLHDIPLQILKKKPTSQ